jgi:hypothetical protein
MGPLCPRRTMGRVEANGGQAVQLQSSPASAQLIGSSTRDPTHILAARRLALQLQQRTINWKRSSFPGHQVLSSSANHHTAPPRGIPPLPGRRPSPLQQGRSDLLSRQVLAGSKLACGYVLRSFHTFQFKMIIISEDYKRYSCGSRISL